MIEVGQDALGGWAWMLFDQAGAMLACGHSLHSIEAAVELAGEAFAEAKIRGEPRMPARPHISFPDGA